MTPDQALHNLDQAIRNYHAACNDQAEYVTGWALIGTTIPATNNEYHGWFAVQPEGQTQSATYGLTELHHRLVSKDLDHQINHMLDEDN